VTMLEDTPNVRKECGNDGIVVGTRVDWVIYVDQAQDPAIAMVGRSALTMHRGLDLQRFRLQ